MKEINYNYYFNNDFNIIFFSKKNYIIIKKKTRFFSIKLPSVYFIKLRENLISFFFFEKISLYKFF